MFFFGMSEGTGIEEVLIENSRLLLGGWSIIC